MRVILSVVGMALATPAAAQSAEGIWRIDGATLSAPLAQVSFPTEIAGVKLTKTSEFSHKGEKLDNVAEYKSPDGDIWGTIYIYRPGYPDAAIAAYATDRTMPQIYGTTIRRADPKTTAFAGTPDAAIVIDYTGGVFKNSGPLASASSFSRIGGWIVKIRMSGPVARQAEIDAALTALQTAARVDAKAVLFKVRPLQFGAPCPAAPSGTVKLLRANGDVDANALGAAMIVAAAGETDQKSLNTLDFPANGLMPVCVRGTVTLGRGPIEVLQPSTGKAADSLIVVLNDVDDVLTIRKNFIGTGFKLMKTDIGAGTVLGTIDRLPDSDELARIVSGQVDGALVVSAKTTIKADGSTNLTISTDKK